ncbi:MAG TPA: PD-(D/E)XK nuclease family protein [Acidimicrobiales bacterium]|nr:PD-(D/E)XK nuclease family protein [Acidimicrobiales bacterium]
MGWAEADVRWVEPGPPAGAAVAEAVAAAKGADPLAPVTVAVPSVFAGLGLRRALARGGGLVNVRFLVLARVAELLGAPALAAAGRRPLTRARRAEAARRALLDDPGPFGDVAAHPATVRSVERVAAELRRAGPAAVAALAAVDSHTAHLVRLARRAHALTGHFYDEHDLCAAAARAVRAEGMVGGDIGHVVLFLPRQVHAGEAALLDALAEAGSLTVLAGHVADGLGHEATARLVPAAPPPVAVAPPRGTAVLVAPDPDVEVRAVVREIAARLHAGTPLHRIAVVYRSPRPYRLLLHEHLGAARLPYRGSATRTLAQTAAGRLLLGLLRLPAERFARTAVLDWLTCSPVLESPGGDPVPSLRWESIARAAHVVAGEGQWRDRLGRYRRAVARRLERRVAEGDDDAGTEGLRTELDHVDRLAAFVGELVGNASPPGRASWAAHVAWARSMLHRYLGGEGRRARWPDDELEAARAVEAALDGMAELDDVSPEPDGASFAWVLEEQLRVPFGRQGRFGDGVFVGRVDDVVGQDLDVLFVLGMGDGAFPERRRPDGLLDDRAREAAGGALPTARTRLAEQRRDYLWALAAARHERVLSLARADDRGRRERLPSAWLLETASHLAGRTLYADDLLSHPPAPWLRRVPSFAALPAEPPPEEHAASAQELRLASLWSWAGAGGRLHDHPLVRREPALQRGLEARRARRTGGLSRWTGLVGPLAAEARPFDRVQSATGLQWWATCPRRFFFERLLEVAETPVPEDELQLPPLEAGTLVHAALERFLAEAPARSSPEQPWSAAERDLLAAILDEEFADAERRGITGRPLLWRIQRRRLRRDVLGFLDHDERARARHGVVPVAGELGFGLAHEGEQPAVEVVTPAGRKLLFRGKVDRVDAAPDGSRLVVLDYKTGSPQRYTTLADDPVQAGRSLQLPLYALAARARFGDVPTEAAYWFVSERADYRRFPVTLDEQTNARFLAVLDAVADGVEAGVFPANPGKDDGRRRHAHCAICPYDSVCPRDRRQAWDRALADAASEPYRRLGGAE